MNEFIVNILPDIDHILKGVTPNLDQQNDVRQELIIKIYENEKKVNEIVANGQNIKGWLFMVAKNIHLQAVKKQSRFSDLPASLVEEKDEHYKPNIKTTEDMMAVLSPIEQMWIEAYIECGFNCSELERQTGSTGKQDKISRRHAKERIKTIFERWKQLDIYLP